MTINSAAAYWQDMLKILDIIGIEMESLEADEEIVAMGIDAIIADIQTNQSLVGGGKPLRNSWRIKHDGMILKLTIEAQVTTESFELSDSDGQ